MLRASPKVACSRLTLIESHRAVRRAVVLNDLVETSPTAGRIASVLSFRVLDRSLQRTRGALAGALRVF